jgi:DNA polymerase elongation subunit (family B)
MDSLFIYAWHLDDKQKEVTSIRIYGLTKDNKNVCLRVDDFTPYVYLELPDFVAWNSSKAQIVAQKIGNIMGRSKPLKSSLVMRRKLYYSHLDEKGNHKEFPFLFLAFSSKSDINILSYKLKEPITVPQIGSIRFKMHEQKASPALQLQCFCDIPSAGWASFRGTQVSDEERLTNCDLEYYVRWKNLKPHVSEDVVSPYVMCYDIEVYSSNPNKMPTGNNPRDKIFQMSCVFFRVGSTDYERLLFSLGDPDPEVVGSGTIVIRCDTESDLLEQYAKVINDKQPNIICGYNIFKFDIPYMIERAKLCRVIDIFSKHGFSRYDQAQERVIKWSSTAFKNQEFSYLDADGRLFVDLLPLIQRDFKFSSYSLKTVSDFFIGETKDPLTAKGIFRCYDLGMKGDEKGMKALGIVGKYCVQDSVLVAKLFDKLQTWFGLSEMAKICNVSIFDLYTQGQQKKVYSQVYKYCMAENIVVESDGYVSKEDDHYQGAHVFEPIPGVYDCVVPFDFASLYPSIIIAYNIDFTTLIPDDSTIPDSDCHTVEWSEHVSCEHDTVKRKTKSKYRLCGHRCFKFLKTHRGVLPTLLVNLLDARKKTRATMKEISKKMETCSPEERDTYETLLNVLEKRQLSYKVSANSMYGSLGVRSGYLPLMPAAMCVTAIGRKSILKVADVITSEHGARIILGDTDSVYCIFDRFGKDTRAIWEWCEKVSDSISKLFPKPMKLEFEGVIYWRFLTLTKKRYMSIECDKEGNISKKIKKKGVLLTRRDNSNFVRSVYESCIMKIFNQEPKENILYTIIEQFNKLYSNSFDYKDFIITKSVGSTTINEDGKVIVAPLDKLKGLVGNYKVPLLAEDGSKKKMSQYLLKKATTDDEYYLRCLPSQVQLAEKMKRRGQRVDAGTRLEFLVVKTHIDKPKLYEQLESWDYFKDHSGVLNIDFSYYLKAISVQLDQVLSCTVDVKSFGKEQLDIRKKKQKVIDQIKSMNNPRIIIEYDDPIIIIEE